MAELTDKEKIIKQVYEDKELGYGSLRDTFQQAVKKDPNIKYDDVKSYLNKLPHRQTQFKYKGFNSFVSQHPLFELEVDLIDLTKKAKENNGFRYCLVAIDNFTKFAWGVAMKTKKPNDIINAFKEILEKIGIPKQIYTDEEGAFYSTKFVILLNEKKIKHITSISGAHVVERFNRTLKEKIQTRLDAMGLDRDKWLEQLKPILNKYNNTEHSVTKVTPNDALKKDNEMIVKFNLELKSRRQRKYPELKKDDEVRVLQKKEAGKTKGYFPKWSKVIYKVLHIRDSDYMINDGKRKLYLRHELLKV